MDEQQLTGDTTEADARSLSEKLRAFAATLTPGERALLESTGAYAIAATGEDDVEGYLNAPAAPTGSGPKYPPGSRPIPPRPGSSAQPPR